MQRTEDGQGLFVQFNGSPMVFHLPPGSTKKKLAPVIKQHGGEITSRNGNDVIRLADEKLWTSRLLTSSPDCYWPTFIVDCVKQNTLLDMELYKCHKGRGLMRRIPPEGGNDSTVDEYKFDFGGALPATVKSKKGRMHYTKAEDMNILKYLMENGEYSRAKGTAVWKTMEKLQITPHSAQSMMTRFRKVILAQMDSYNIPDSWKTRLTGDLARYAPTSTTTTTTTTTTAATSTRSTAARGDRQGRVSDCEGEDLTSMGAAWLQPSTSKAGQRTNRPREEKDQQSSVDGFIDDAENDEETCDSFDQPLLRSKAGRQTNGPREKDRQPSVDAFIDDVENGEEAHDSLDQQLLQMVQAEVHAEFGGDNTRTRRSARVPGGSAAEPVVNSTVAERSPAKKRRAGRAGGSESEQKDKEEEEIAAMPSLNPPKKRSHRLLPQDAAWRSRSPSRSPRKSAASATVDSDLSQEERQTSGSPSRAKAARHRRPDDGGTPSTTSTLPCPVTPPVVRRSLRHASPLSEREECVPESMESSSDSDNYPLLSRKLFVSGTEKSGKRGEKPAKRMTVLGAIRALSQEFGLALKEAQVLLRRNSGHVGATRYWIMTGRTLPGHFYWTWEEDQVLLTCEPDHPDWQKLEQKYGLSPVLKRVQWLQS